jgi:hypothetical protein
MRTNTRQLLPVYRADVNRNLTTILFYHYISIRITEGHSQTLEIARPCCRRSQITVQDESEDGGRSWSQLSVGVGGPVDFHQMDVSPADPKTIYGAYGGNLQISRDGGQEWEVVGPAPQGLIDLAASAKDPSTLYAATQVGLLKSEDGGRTWQDAYWLRQPATMVHVAPGGAVYAFVVGTGLIETAEPKLSWQSVSEHGFDRDYVLHLAVDPASHNKLYAITINPQEKVQAVLVFCPVDT